MKEDELLYEELMNSDSDLLLNGGGNMDRREPGIDYSDDSQQESSVRVGQPEVTAP